MIAVLALLLGATGALAASVTPIAYDNMEHKDAAHICVTELGFDWGLKIEAWGGDRDMNGTYSGAYDSKGKLHEDFENVITLSKATRYSFDWASAPYAIGAVVVQGGPMDNIFVYDPAVNEDEYLYPYKKFDKGKQETISHLNFCWNKTDENGEDECYQEETAWAANGDVPLELRYIGASQWATYVEFEAEKTVSLFAGRTIPAGTVTFSAPVDGWVTITVNLENGFVFYYDLADEEEDDNLKVQDYEFPPEGNPAIGLFDWKTFIPGGSTTGTIVVPVNNYYGVHLDVAFPVECE
ncbi:MAG: phage baseplate assembly protein [Anaerolineaceae bacterium]|nr:phage baseplate assembly protein [Anaerolineaceae bacterium]